MDKEGGLRNSVRAVAGSGLAIWMLCEGSEARRRSSKQDYGGGEMFIQRQGWVLPEFRKGAPEKAVRGITNILALCVTATGHLRLGPELRVMPVCHLSEQKTAQNSWTRADLSGLTGMEDRSGGRVGQSDRVLSDGIKLHQAKRRPGTGEVRFTGAQHVRTKVQAILVNETRS